MPRRVQYGGKVHEFPDDATDEEISTALQPLQSNQIPTSYTEPPLQPGEPGYFQEHHPNLSNLINMFGAGMPGPAPLAMAAPAGEIFSSAPQALSQSLAPAEMPQLASDMLKLIPKGRMLSKAYQSIKGLGSISSSDPALEGVSHNFWDMSVPHGRTATLPFPEPYVPEEGATAYPSLKPQSYGEPGAPKSRVPYYKRDFKYIQDIRDSVQSTPQAAPSPLNTKPPTLPSGRVPGEIRPLLGPEEMQLPKRAPLWDVYGAQPTPRKVPEFSSIPSVLPSGRIPGVPKSALQLPGEAVPPSPIQPPTQINPNPVPPSGIQPLEEVVRTPNRNPSKNPWVHANDALHATIQDIELPGSPAGSKAAGKVSGWAKTLGVERLNPGTMDNLREFLVTNKRWPNVGELRSLHEQ